MSELTLKSESQIQSEMLATLISQLGLNDINPSSVIDLLTQTAASSDFNLMVQISQVSRLNDLNFIRRGDLDLKGTEYGLVGFLPKLQQERSQSSVPSDLRKSQLNSLLPYPHRYKVKPL